MKKSIILRYSSFLSCLTAAAVGCLLLTSSLSAQDTNSMGSQKRFDSADDATKALMEATRAGDMSALNEILGPSNVDVSTGDAVQDKNNFEHFTKAMDARCVQEPEGNDRVILGIGTNDWPFPIPLVKQDGKWVFDTAAGREEIINRHIGRDELHAIGVCRAYVTAQGQYFSHDRDHSGVRKYAQKFKSTPGMKDGLYWDSTDEASPFSALVAEAHAEGYGHHAQGSGPHPFHGYLFRILTSQGRAAPGGKSDYLIHGSLIGGFALVAYPVEWGKSGIMTFIVNQDGKVYQHDFQEKTAETGAKMTRYNPDSRWTLVTDAGIAEP